MHSTAVSSVRHRAGRLRLMVPPRRPLSVHPARRSTATTQNHRFYHVRPPDHSTNVMRSTRRPPAHTARSRRCINMTFILCCYCHQTYAENARSWTPFYRIISLIIDLARRRRTFAAPTPLSTLYQYQHNVPPPPTSPRVQTVEETYRRPLFRRIRPSW